MLAAGMCLHAFLAFSAYSISVSSYVNRSKLVHPLSCQRGVQQALAWGSLGTHMYSATLGAWIWDAEVVDWAGNEVALNYQGETRRLDRFVRRKDTGAWWVLDQKFKNQPHRDAGWWSRWRRIGRRCVSPAYEDISQAETV